MLKSDFLFMSKNEFKVFLSILYKKYKRNYCVYKKKIRFLHCENVCEHKLN